MNQKIAGKRLGIFGFGGVNGPAWAGFHQKNLLGSFGNGATGGGCGRLSFDFWAHRRFVAIEALRDVFRRDYAGPSHWVFEKRGKREDATVSWAFESLMSSGCTHEFVAKERGLAGLEMADMLARPIGLSVLRPAQPNRALEGIRERVTIVVV
jgi:hypothetical protein